jgi:surface carbohydrate biosynthesis protein
MSGGGRSPRVCIIVDNPLRDLDGLVLTGWFLARRGVEVFLLSMSNNYEAFFLSPDMVVVNYVRKANSDFVARCKRMGFPVGVLDTEGGVLKDAEAYFAKVFNYVDTVDLYCLWGMKQQEAMRKINRLPEDVIKVTGCPRYDFCVPPWSEALPDVSVERGRKMVLVNTSFPTIQPRFQSPEKEAKQLVKDAGFEAEFVEELLRQTRIARGELVESAMSLARKFQEPLFVIRPHPFEDRTFYDETFSGFRNVEVHQSGPVCPWIKRAEVVLHRSCATAIETVLMGKEPIHVEWSETPVLAQPSSIDVSLRPGSQEELEQMIKSVLEGKSPKVPEQTIADRERIIRDWFFSNDGKNSERAAGEMLETLGGTKDRTPVRSGLFRELIASPLASGDLRRFIKHAAIILLGSGYYNRLKRLRYPAGKEFGVAEVRDIVGRIEKAAGIPGAVSTDGGAERNRLIRHAVRLAYGGPGLNSSGQVVH